MELKTDTARYDRQLRLWGEEGQSFLEGAKICLLNACSSGTETLKNLILPGIGSFTIVDEKKVEESDLGCNFFVDSFSLGKSRAIVSFQLLQELNSLSKGEYLEQDPVSLIENSPNYFKKFTLVIATEIPEIPLRKLAQVLWSERIPLVVVRAYGMIGYIRVVTPEHTVIESKPDDPRHDLRLLDPFPELSQYAASFDFEKMNSTEHSHTPFVIILLQYLAKYKKEYGKYPVSRAEKDAFRNEVIKGSRNPGEENFAEAYRSVLLYLVQPEFPSSVKSILNDPKATNITPESDKFWIMVSALKGFVDNEGKGFLPLRGSIPDMTSTTTTYITLQKLYQDKANADVLAVETRVKSILNSIGKPEKFISLEELRKFCRNSMFLQLLRYRSLEEEFTSPKISLIDSELKNSSSKIFFYVLLRAIDQFYTQHRRYPGSTDDQVKEDETLLGKYVNNLISELGISSPLDDIYVKEMVRFGAAELHPVVSLLGGIASQEVIKLITHQYTPLENTFIFNGIDCTTSCYSL